MRFVSFIVKNHPSIIKKIIKNDPVINNLYMDCNSIVYDIAHALNINDHSDNYQDQTDNIHLN